MEVETRRRTGRVARITRNRTIGMSEHRLFTRECIKHFTRFTHQFRAIGLGTEMHVATSNGIARLHDFPFLVRFTHRALGQRVATPFEAAQSPWRPQSFELPSTLWRGRAGSNQARSRSDGAVAVDGINFDFGACVDVD